MTHNTQKPSLRNDGCNEGNNKVDLFYPVALTKKVMHGKWKLEIIWNLKKGTQRFCELQREILTTQSYLTKQLRELETDGMVCRKIYQGSPPKVEYSLTKIGRDFSTVIEAMSLWGNDYITTLKKAE